MVMRLCRMPKRILFLRPCRRKRVSSRPWSQSLRQRRGAGPPPPGGASRPYGGGDRCWQACVPASPGWRPSAPTPAPAAEARPGSGPGLVSHGSHAQPGPVSTRWSPAPCGRKATSPVDPLSGCFYLQFSGLSTASTARATRSDSPSRTLLTLLTSRWLTGHDIFCCFVSLIPVFLNFGLTPNHARALSFLSVASVLLAKFRRVLLLVVESKCCFGWVLFVTEPGLVGLTVSQVCAGMRASLHTSTAVPFLRFF